MVLVAASGTISRVAGHRAEVGSREFGSLEVGY